MLRWAAGGLGPNGPARMEPTWQVAAGLGRPSRALSLSLSKSLLFSSILQPEFRRKERGARGGIFQKRKYPWSLENMQNLNKLVWQFLEEEK